MAQEILDAIVAERSIAHEPRHDVESFIWVLCYSLGRRWVLDSKGINTARSKKLHDFFHTHFGRMTLDAISLSRDGQGPLKIAERFPELSSLPMAGLLRTLRSHVQVSALLQNFIPLTYGIVLAAFNEAIRELDK